MKRRCEHEKETQGPGWVCPYESCGTLRREELLGLLLRHAGHRGVGVGGDADDHERRERDECDLHRVCACRVR